MSFIPSIKLYESDGVTLKYTFETVQSINAPQTVKDMIEIKNPRGKGSLIIDGGQASWDLTIKGIIYSEEDDGGEAYKDLTEKIDELEGIAIGTAYVLKIDKDELNQYEYNVKRITPIEYTENLRTSYIPYRVTLRANSW